MTIILKLYQVDSLSLFCLVLFLRCCLVLSLGTYSCLVIFVFVYQVSEILLVLKGMSCIEGILGAQ